MKKILFILFIALFFINYVYAENNINIDNPKIDSLVHNFLFNNFDSIIGIYTDNPIYDKYEIINNSNKQKVIIDDFQEIFFRVYDYDIYNIESYDNMYCVSVVVNGLDISNTNKLKYFSENSEIDKDDSQIIRAGFKLIIKKTDNEYKILKDISSSYYKMISNNKVDKEVEEFHKKELYSNAPALIKQGFEDPYDYYFDQFKKGINSENIDDNIMLVKYMYKYN